MRSSKKALSKLALVVLVAAPVLLLPPSKAQAYNCCDACVSALYSCLSQCSSSDWACRDACGATYDYVCVPPCEESLQQGPLSPVCVNWFLAG